MSVYKDPSQPENVRIDAAKAAIRYERPALAPADHRADSDFVTLAERIAYYKQRDAMEPSETKAVELKKRGWRCS